MADELSFTYGEKRAETMGIQQQAPAYISAPIPRVESTTIPGRSGDLLKWDGAYENRTAQIDCFLLSGILDHQITALQAWLIGSQTYKKLTFDDDPNHFMLARPTLGADKQARVNLLNPFTLEFDCKPQRYLNLGQREIDVTQSLKLYNPTAFNANPIIHIRGNGNVSVSYANASLSVLNLNGDLFYDTETDKAYNASGSLDRYVMTAGNMSIPGGAHAVYKFDQYATEGEAKDYETEVGGTFSISYSEMGITTTPGGVEFEGSGRLSWYDDGGVIVFTGTAPGEGTATVILGGDPIYRFTYRVKSTGQIEYIGFVPRWWEL